MKPLPFYCGKMGKELSLAVLTREATVCLWYVQNESKESKSRLCRSCKFYRKKDLSGVMKGDQERTETGR